MHYLYKISDTLNNKVYIGQSKDDKHRWRQHVYFSKNPEKTGQYIHRAMAKYGVENFIFEIIAICKTQEDANETESLLIKQYESRNKDFGYNLMTGGSYGGHSEETKQKQREATIKQIETQGHPAAGRIVSQETRELMRKIRLENPVEYTEEKRKNMSESHLGIKDTIETKRKKSEKAKLAWEKRQAEKLATGELRCSVLGCNAEGIRTYILVEGIRYCSKHGQRLKRKGSLDSLRD